MNTAAGLPLAGVTILDFTQVMAGPYCTRLLVESGAQVIKVEPVDGEIVRRRPPLTESRSRYFGQLNAGKQSLAIDMKRPEAQALVRRMLPKVDVIVENFRPGVMARFGLDAEACRRVRPALVYCSISGYGQSGPEAGHPAVAPVIHASAGLDMALMEQLDLDRPPVTGLFTADVLAGAIAFGAIGAALRDAAVTGNGATLDMSMTDAVLSLMVHEVQVAQVDEPIPSAAYQPTRTSDGYLMVAVVTDRHMKALARVLDSPELATDPLFASMAARRFNTSALMHHVEAWTSTRSCDEVDQAFSDGDVPCGRYRSVAERIVDPVLRERGSVHEARDGAGAFVTVSATPRRTDLAGEVIAAPRSSNDVADLGFDTANILRTLGGLDDDEIRELLADGTVVGNSP